MKFFLVGIKGSGMSALANILYMDGYHVEGNDMDSKIYTDKQTMKFKIYDLDYKNIDKNAIVIVGHSFEDDYLIKYLKDNNIIYFLYNDFINFYFNKNKLVSICGSHGKTTLTKMLSSLDSSFLIGDGEGYKSKREEFIFLESCEYKDHYYKYHPNFIIITNIDYDHVDYFKSKEDYQNSFKKFSLKSDYGLVEYDYKDIVNDKFLTYGLNDKADFYLKNYKFDENGIKGDIYFKNKLIYSFKYKHIYGEPLLKDVLVTYAFYYLHNYDLYLVDNRLKEFKMANKRFNIEYFNEYVFIDDYAHHPTQIETNYNTLRSMFKNERIIAIFKPDRISRFDFFENKFKYALELFDKAYILDFKENNKGDHYYNWITFIKKEEEIIKYLNKGDKIYVFMSSKDMSKIQLLVKNYLLNK